VRAADVLAMIAFPFRLAFAHPWTMARTFALIVLVSCLATFASALLRPSLDATTSEDITRHALTLLALGAFSIALMAGATAPLAVASLQYVGLRDRPFGLSDVAPYALVTVLLMLGRGLVTGLADLTYVEAAFAESDVAAGRVPIVSWVNVIPVVIIVAVALLYARLWLVGPAALQDRTLGFRTSWLSTRNKLWRSLGYALLVVILSRGVWELVIALGAPTIAELALSSPQALFESGAILSLVGLALVDALIWAFTAAATVFAFAKITDRLLPEQTSA
jgi:hypothetical protein